jgi:hypothetical protein
MEKLNLQPGDKYGRLELVRVVDKVDYQPIWLCRCVCGKESHVRQGNLRSGHTVSCGCAWNEAITSHGLHDHPIYMLWAKIKDRCGNQNSDNYENYGGRGISICAEWAESFPAFLAAVGERPSMGHSIDRYPNQNGNYEPGNVRWANRRQQANNMRRNRRVAFDGRVQNLAEWAREIGIKEVTLRSRLIYRKWTVRKSLTEPLRRAA